MLCPSAQPEIVGSMAFGVVGGTVANPRVTWIEKPVPVTDGLLAQIHRTPANASLVGRFVQTNESFGVGKWKGAQQRPFDY